MRHKIAIFSDVHGNYTALKAVYEDMQEQGVTESWFLGDLFAPGSGAQDLWDLMQKINPDVYIRGNWDDLMIRGAAGKIALEKPSKVYMERLAMDVAAKVDPQVLATMKRWPMRVVKQINDVRIAITHDLPEINFGQQLYPTLPTENFNKLFVEDDLERTFTIQLCGTAVKNRSSLIRDLSDNHLTAMLNFNRIYGRNI